MHLKMLEDQARDNYAANQRAMTKAAAASCMQQLGEKQSKENALRNYEMNRDRTDLNRVNATQLNPTATLSAGTSASFKMM